MRPPPTYTLRDDLRARAEWFFGEPLGDVRVHVGPLPDRHGATALAVDSAVYLSPRAAALPAGRLAELLGHELAHVVQQRRGRVRRRAGVDDDPALEREASELGRRLCRVTAPRGLVASPLRSPPPRPPRGPIQRLVKIAGTPVGGLGELSARANGVLSLIPDGAAWLAWAIGSGGANYGFADEASMLAAIQTGLNGAHLLLLRRCGLWIGPAKLVTLPIDGLGALLRRESGDDGSIIETQARKVIADEGLVTLDDLVAGRRFLDELGLADAPLFRATTVPEQVALFELVKASSSATAMREDLQREAARFAVERAASTLEFVDLYKTYVVFAVKRGLLEGKPEDRARGAAALDVLRPLLYACLDSPQLPAPAPAPEVARQIRAFVGAGRRVGFPRISAGALQIALYTKFLDESGDNARAFVDGYIREAQSFIANHPPTTARISQDGVTTLYTVTHGGAEAELGLDESGGLTLRSFRLVRAAPTEPEQKEESSHD